VKAVKFRPGFVSRASCTTLHHHPTSKCGLAKDTAASATRLRCPPLSAPAGTPCCAAITPHPAGKAPWYQTKRKGFGIHDHLSGIYWAILPYSPGLTGEMPPQILLVRQRPIPGVFFEHESQRGLIIRQLILSVWSDDPYVAASNGLANQLAVLREKIRDNCVLKKELHR
jgi:hypothetical protein